MICARVCSHCGEAGSDPRIRGAGRGLHGNPCLVRVIHLSSLALEIGDFGWGCQRSPVHGYGAFVAMKPGLVRCWDFAELILCMLRMHVFSYDRGWWRGLRHLRRCNQG